MKIKEIREKEIQELNSRNALAEAGQCLQSGGLVAFPTETVYGLGADALNPLAAEKIYKAKGRPSDNPLIVHVADFESLEKITKEIPWQAKVLADKFWPGPMTMIMKKEDCVPDTTTGGLDSVAVRMPAHQVALALIKAGGGYVAAPSANTSGRPSPTKASHVAEDMDGKIDYLIDGGDVGIGLESTIIDLTEEIPVLLRPGAISKEMLEEVIGEVRIDEALLKADETIRPKAPGMKYKHYAPKAQLTVVEGETSAVVKKINECVRERLESMYEESKDKEIDLFDTCVTLDEVECRIGIICTEETRLQYPYGVVKCIGSIHKEEEIAKNLYGVLREFDNTMVEEIFSEGFETPKMGYAIMNRLLKAAGHHRIKV